jgi:hypothetical protein
MALDTPILLSAMTTTVPVTADFGSSTMWTKDSRYTQELKILRMDAYRNQLEYEERKYPRAYGFVGYKGSKLLGSYVCPGTSALYTIAYTSFEYVTARTNEEDYFATTAIVDHDSWLLDGTRTTANAFTGKNAFIGRARYNGTYDGHTGFFINGNIYVAVLATGNAPYLERYDQATGTYTTLSVTPTLLTTIRGWKIYGFLGYSNGGAMLVVNSNGNYMDELRMGYSMNDFDQELSSYSYDEEGRLYQILDKHYRSRFFVYDSWGRKIIDLDDNKKILKKYTYQVAGPNQ